MSEAKGFNPLEIGSTLQISGLAELTAANASPEFQSPRNRVNTSNGTYYEEPILRIIREVSIP